MFKAEATRNAFKKIQKFSDASTDETPLCALCQFDAVITHTVDCFVNIANDIGVPSNTHQNDQDRNQEVPNAVAPLIESNKGVSIPRDIACKLKRLLLVAAISLMNSRLNLFKREAVVSGVDIESEISFKTVGSETARLRNGETELTITFEMPPNGHYYISLAAHAFKEYFSDWIGLVNDCYVLQVSPLDGRPTTFNSDFPLAKFNESDKEINN